MNFHYDRGPGSDDSPTRSRDDFSRSFRERLVRWVSAFSGSPVRAAFIVTLVALSAPIWLTPYPPLVDYPNHLSRIHILEHLDEDRFFQERFEVAPPFPNMAMELVMPVFMGAMDVETAGKLFLNLYVMLFAAGCWLISAGLRGKLTWAAVIAMFLVYGSCFFYGFTNYLFGLGVYMVIFGWRLTWGDRVTPLRAAALFPLAFLAYFCHLTSFVFLGFSFGVYWLYETYVRRTFNMGRTAWTFAPFAPPIILHLSTAPSVDGRTFAVWGSFSNKIITGFGWLISYDYPLDALFGAWLLAAGLLLMRRGGIDIDKQSAALATAFWAVFLVAPQALLTSWAANARLVPPAMVFSVFAIRPTAPRKLSAILLTVTLAALLGRVALIARAWREGSDLIAEQIDMSDHIEPHSTVYPMYWPSRDRQTDKRERGIEHAVAYAAIRRQAFVLNTFAIPGQHLLVFRDPSVQRAQTAVQGFSSEDWERAFAETDLDYAWTWRAPENARREIEQRCELVAERGHGRLYRVRSKADRGERIRDDAAQFGVHRRKAADH